jgi:hypothetical protein
MITKVPNFGDTQFTTNRWYVPVGIYNPAIGVAYHF